MKYGLLGPKDSFVLKYLFGKKVICLFNVDVCYVKMRHLTQVVGGKNFQSLFYRKRCLIFSRDYAVCAHFPCLLSN